MNNNFFSSTEHYGNIMKEMLNKHSISNLKMYVIIMLIFYSLEGVFLKYIFLSFLLMSFDFYTIILYQVSSL